MKASAVFPSLAYLRRLLATAAVVAPLFLCGTANLGLCGKAVDAAKKEQVRQLYDEGMAYYKLGKFDDAVRNFEKAYLLVPDPAFLYNIGQSQRMAGRTVEAIRIYKTYLREVPNAPNASDVKEWVGQLEKSLEKAQSPTPAPFSPPPPVATQAAPPPPLPPPAVPYLEPKSKHNYLTRMPIDGKDYALIGVSHRSYIGMLLYGVGLYVEEEPARRAFPKLVEKAGGTDLAQLRARDLAQNFVVLGEFGKAAVLYYGRDIPANKIRDSYRDMLKDNLKPEVAPTLRQHTEQFLSLFARDMKKGEVMIIHTTGDGRIIVTSDDDKRFGPQDPTLCIDLWNLWIGQKAINSDLKQGLVERIQALGGTAQGK